jgi:hypothetical protein
MKPAINDFSDGHRYQLLAEVAHADLMPFVQLNLKARNPVTLTYLALNILLIAVTSAVVGWHLRLGSFGPLMTYASFGVLLTFTVLIVLHEWIHGLTYRMLGAQRVSYGGNWRKLIFYALADRYVADRKNFVKLALAPFAVISVVALAGLLLATGPVKGLFLSILLFHTGCCAGDFAMVSFFWQHRHTEVFTYDDAVGKKSYFYAQVSRQGGQ